MSVAPIVSNQNRNAQAPSAPAAATSTNPPAPIGQALTGEARIAAEQAGRPIVRHPVSNTVGLLLEVDRRSLIEMVIDRGQHMFAVPLMTRSAAC